LVRHRLRVSCLSSCFPTRRSSDLPGPDVMKLAVGIVDASAATPVPRSISMLIPQARAIATLKYIGTGSYPFVGGLQAEAKLTNSDRKSTRLNSSHGSISYAVFCLK